MGEGGAMGRDMGGRGRGFVRRTKTTLPPHYSVSGGSVTLKRIEMKKKKNGIHLLVNTPAMEIETWEFFMVDAVI